MPATDGMPVDGIRVAFAPAALDVAVVVVPVGDGEADRPRADARPKLVTVSMEWVERRLEVEH
jgi:hypothetical protein